MIVTRVDQLIGKTPIIRLNHLSDSSKGIDVFGKVEAFNPGYSVKDRSALQLLEQAKKDYDLKPGTTIVESSSGNMGHALAMLCAISGFRFICVLDPKTPKANISLVRSFGGTVAIVDTPDHTGGYQQRRIATARAIAEAMPNCINLDQYNNPAAIDAHLLHTGPEITSQMGSDIDVFIGSVSTGAHLSGIAKHLKSRNPNVHIVAVEPVGSSVFGGPFKPFLQNGLGLSFRPGNMWAEYVDEVVRVSDREAFTACRDCARSDGLLLGGSSGAIMSAASAYAARASRPQKIVTLLPDGGLKYLESIYDDDWLIKHGMEDVVERFAQPAHHADASALLSIIDRTSKTLVQATEQFDYAK